MRVIVWKAVTMAKIDFDHTNAKINTEVPSRYHFCLFGGFFFFFFLLVKIFRKFGPLLTKIPGSAPEEASRMCSFKKKFYRYDVCYLVNKE